MLVNNQVQRFKQLERKGNQKVLRKIQADLSSSIGSLAGPVHYRVMTPLLQVTPAELPEEENDQATVTSRPIIDQVQTQPFKPPSLETKATFPLDLSLDPGDPANKPEVPMLIPQHDGSKLVGFAVGNPDYAGSWSDTKQTPQTEEPAQNPKGPEKTGPGNLTSDKPKETADPILSDVHTKPTGTRPKKSHTEYKNKMPPEQIPHRPPFQIYHDPPPPQKRQMDPPLQNLERELDQLRLYPDMLSRKVQKSMAHPQPTYGGYMPQDYGFDTRSHSTPRRRLDYDNPRTQQGTNPPHIDPYTMDDPSFPKRWRIPPGHILQNWYKHWDLGKLWKHSDQIAVFEGSIQQYLRWAPTFYEMVHIQPMPWAYKLNILSKKLAPKVSTLVIGGLAFEKRDYITALCRLECYFGGEEKLAQARLAALENFPEIQQDDWVAMRKFLDALETYAQSGPFDPYPHSRENVMTMTLVKHRMPPAWYQKFMTWCLEHDRVCIPSNFLVWANNRVDPHLLDMSFSTNTKSSVTFLSSYDPVEVSDFTFAADHPTNVINANCADLGGPYAGYD